ncbi:unnamed protein product [Parascedosporium putredinis]|uniref:DNA-directed RNA polymerase RBP11-like dimerisation domain-containing protein n=1 Tax=Parascedosporium putredinis TaxID=1442378 RepID=A0A9P1M7A1_9PEZI|nr:unnamed protein product [Parascedosporium putredinis]CAI7987478.1 unnamed protein product [Parascedosporium putredinis]
MNAPDRFELFLLGERRSATRFHSQVNLSQPDPCGLACPGTQANNPLAIPNCSDFVIKKEDHTIGNVVSEQLKKHRNVLFAGYKIPHPNVPELFIRIQTDGSITPKEALLSVLEKLLRDLNHLSQEFTREWELRRMVTEGEQNQNGNP